MLQRWLVVIIGLPLLLAALLLCPDWVTVIVDHAARVRHRGHRGL